MLPDGHQVTIGKEKRFRGRYVVDSRHVAPSLDIQPRPPRSHSHTAPTPPTPSCHRTLNLTFRKIDHIDTLDEDFGREDSIIQTIWMIENRGMAYGDRVATNPIRVPPFVIGMRSVRERVLTSIGWACFSTEFYGGCRALVLPVLSAVVVVRSSLTSSYTSQLF